MNTNYSKQYKKHSIFSISLRFSVIFVFFLINTKTISQNFGGCGTGTFTEGYNAKTIGCAYNSDDWLSK